MDISFRVPNGPECRLCLPPLPHRGHHLSRANMEKIIETRPLFPACTVHIAQVDFSCREVSGLNSDPPPKICPTGTSKVTLFGKRVLPAIIKDPELRSLKRKLGLDSQSEVFTLGL